MRKIPFMAIGKSRRLITRAVPAAKPAAGDVVAEEFAKAATDRAEVNRKRMLEDLTIFSSFVPALDIPVGGTTTRATIFQGMTSGGGNEWRTNIRSANGGPDEPMIITDLRFLLDNFAATTGAQISTMLQNILLRKR